MDSADLNAVAIEAMRLQNGYALSIDTRDWEQFQTLFTPDVQAIYPNATYHGMQDWLATFIPFHDGCGWTLHAMSTHNVGTDDNGIWASCYGSIEWTQNDTPGSLYQARVIYRDRLSSHEGRLRIARRQLNVLMGGKPQPIAEHTRLPNSVLDLADRS